MASTRLPGVVPVTTPPHAPACARNQAPILAVLKPRLVGCRRLLEIGSGTGQHAVFCAAAMPWLDWQCSDLPHALPGITARLADAGLPNTPPPVALDVTGGAWPAGPFDAVMTANTLHILHWPAVQALFDGLAQVLADPGIMVVYGPFHRDATATSASNQAFDAWLRARDPASGVRDAGAVGDLARRAGLQLCEDIAMPAHNRSLVFRRGALAQP